MAHREREPGSGDAERAAPRPSEVESAYVRLREAQGLRQGILDSIPDMAWLKDRESRFLAVNERFEQSTGIARQTIVGRTDLELWERERAERYRAEDDEVMRCRKMKRIEESLVDPSGEQVWIETIKIPLLDDVGEVIGTAGIARDITERKRTEEVLRRSHAELERIVRERTAELRGANEALRADIAGRIEAERTQRRLVAILEATPDLVGISDVVGRVQYLNRAGRRMMGFSEEGELGELHVRDFYAPDEAQRIRTEALTAAIRDGLWAGEITLRDRNGLSIAGFQVVIVHRDVTGQAEFLSTIVRDERERKALEAQLLQAQKMEGIGRLAGGIAHDFNNLLTAILGYAELASEKLGPRDPARADLEEIRSAGQRAAELTRQLLAFARKQIIQPAVVDLNQLILSTCGLLRRLIGEHIELVTLPAVDLGLVTIDTGQFQQILVNLAVNARDAMPHGGRLTIATRNVEVGGHDGIAHPELPPGSYVRLAIEDTGSGMDDLVLSHVFEPFFTTKPTGEGTGLGLATCYGIVKQAGGHIAVRSRPDDGTRFEIHLPRVPAELSRPAAESDVALETRGGDETILLVEDEPGVRSLAGRALAARGYRVLAASSGSEALALARSYPERIHLLLSDVVMPRMSGPEIAERLVALRPGVKVLFMSGYTGSGLARPDWLPESAPLLTKPFSAQLLARRVRDELDRPPA